MLRTSDSAAAVYLCFMKLRPTVHQSKDYRVAWRSFVGEHEQRTWGDVSVHDPNSGEGGLNFGLLTGLFTQGRPFLRPYLQKC
jgi:hypothetical protein